MEQLMEQLIEKYKEKKAQLAGQILELDEEPKELNNKEWETRMDIVEKIKVIENQADLYDAMIELAEAFIKLTK